MYASLYKNYKGRTPPQTTHTHTQQEQPVSTQAEKGAVTKRQGCPGWTDGESPVQEGVRVAGPQDDVPLVQPPFTESVVLRPRKCMWAHVCVRAQP